jgi:steroid 5-alpha reductase family enzyme
MTPLNLALAGWAGMALVMLALYLVSRRTGNAGIVDVGWAAGVGGLAILYAALGSGDPARRVLLAVLAGGWGLRLAWHLLVDRFIGRPEDGRYTMLRRQWGDKAERNLALFFQVQAFWALLFSIPFLPVVFSRAVFSWLDIAGAAVWAVAVGGEWTADRQLARFREDPANAGRTCRAGLWRYSRHPNYFFEWIHWFAYPLLAFGSPWWWVSLAGPLVMLVFLLRITGIPYTEKRALESRGDDYRDYQRSTSAFIPWFPKEEKS